MEADYDLRVAESLVNVADAANQRRLLYIQDREIAELWIKGTSGSDLDEIDELRYSMFCGMRIWSAAVQHNRALTLDDAQSVLAEERSMRRDRDEHPGLKTCWEENVAGLRRWGFGPFVDGVHSDEVD